MPATIVKETTVYTLAELEELNWRAHEKAIEKILTRSWEWWEPSDLTEDLVYNISEDFPLFELQQTREGYSNGKERYRPYLFWDMDRFSCEAKGEINIRQYMKTQKFCNKYRALWYAVDTLDCDETIVVSFGNGRDVDLHDLQRQIDYEDSISQPSARYDLLCKQVEALQDDIQSYVDDIQSAVVKHMRAEYDYRYSTEFAKEEAKCHEWTFTEDGEFYDN